MISVFLFHFHVTMVMRTTFMHCHRQFEIRMSQYVDYLSVAGSFDSKTGRHMLKSQGPGRRNLKSRKPQYCVTLTGTCTASSHPRTH